MSVPHLVRPLAAENAAVVRTRLDPTHFYGVKSTAEKPAPEDVRDSKHDTEELDSAFYQAPAGALVWTRRPPAERDPGPGPAGGTDILAVCYARNDKPLEEEKVVVLGVVASPIDDPGLVCRHPDELSFIATFVSGSHTILALEEDCRALVPTNFIKVDWIKPWGRLGSGPDDDTPFYVPRFTRVDTAAEGFAMVLQSGKSELRVLLLQERFNRPGTVVE